MNTDDIRKPWAIRMSLSELRTLETRAKRLDLTKPAFIRLMTLHESVDTQIDALLERKKQRDTGGQILAMLGRTQIPNNLNQIAKSLHCDNYEENEVVIETVDECLSLLTAIRNTQLQGQGLRLQ